MASQAAQTISRGSIKGLFDSQSQTTKEPILQCVHLKSMAPERYRVVLSDIDNFIQSVLSGDLNPEVLEGRLKKGSLLKLTRYQPSEVKGRKILMVLGLQVLTEFGECEKFGEPVALEPKTEPDEAIKQQPTSLGSNGFYGDKPSFQQQQPYVQALPSRGSTGNQKGTTNGNIYPIEALSPYAPRWTIKARCTQKGEIKTWHNKNGEGKLFSVNFLDESGEIRATGFNEQCDALYDVIQEGGVYYVSSPCRVQIAKKQFSNLKHDFELTFERDTQVEKAEDQESVPQIRYNFLNIGDLQTMEKDSTVDTIGVLKEVGQTSQITSKTTSKPYDKRELTLVDKSGYSVRLTVWGNAATTFDAPLESVVAFKGVKVSDFGGRSLSLLSSGSMAVNPDIDEAHKLKGWYDAQGRQDQFATHAGMSGLSGAGRRDECKTVAQVKDENLGMTETAEYFTLRATIFYIKKDTFAYPACLTEGCNKKVVEVEEGQWRCEKCDKSYPKPEYRYIATISACDHTGQIWLTCFNETGQGVFGMTADHLTELKENDERAAMEAFADATYKTFVFRCRAKMDNLQDQARVRYQVNSIQQLNFVAESSKLAETMRKYNGEADSLFVS